MAVAGDYLRLEPYFSNLAFEIEIECMGFET